MRLNRFLTTTAVSLASVACLLGAPNAFARNSGAPIKPGLENETPKELQDIGITEHLGEKVDLGLKFKNEKGEEVALSQYVAGHKPVLLSLAYYNCPSLCNFHLNGLLDSFKEMKAPLGKEFDVVVVSIDARETPEIAAAKRDNYIKAYGRPEGINGWHFLTGTQASIDALSKQVGFKFRWDEEQKQWAHVAAAYALTPEGVISRYHYGIVFEPNTLRLSLIEASNGKVGSIVDKLALYCFHFDPKASKYTLTVFNVVRAGGLMMVVILATFLIPFWFRQRKEQSLT